MIELQTKISTLLKEVRQLQKHQKKINIIKGETFNIFSILGVETKENKTHSNFIAELLNPKGTHYFGTLFLEAFLKQIKYKGNLDITTAKVVKEFNIGKRKIISGGRIDILIKDNFNNLISIENKIYAVDQDNQIIRYANYKKDKNDVYYLTLYGVDASETSVIHEDENQTIVLESGIDYFTLSYANNILEWLQQCQQIAVDIPQLRESIKQYILLIKRLTNQMIDNKPEMIKLLFQSPDVSQYIHDNFKNFKDHIKYEFREDVVKLLKEEFKNKFSINTPNPVHKKGISQIFIDNTNALVKDSKIEILIESFSGFGHHDGQVFIGVIDHTGKNTAYQFEEIEDGFSSDYWKPAQFLEINSKRICFEDGNFLKLISDQNSDSYKKILASFVTQCVKFINVNTPKIELHYNNSIEA